MQVWGKKYIEMAILKQREMLQDSLIQPDFNKGQATPADSPWCTNNQRKLGRSVVYEYRGEKSLRWSNCLRVTQYIIRLWTPWTSSILYHRTDQPVAREPCVVHEWFNPAATSGQHGLPRAVLTNAFLLFSEPLAVGSRAALGPPSYKGAAIGRCWTNARTYSSYNSLWPHTYAGTMTPSHKNMLLQELLNQHSTYSDLSGLYSNPPTSLLWNVPQELSSTQTTWESGKNAGPRMK